MYFTHTVYRRFEQHMTNQHDSLDFEYDGDVNSIKWFEAKKLAYTLHYYPKEGE